MELITALAFHVLFLPAGFDDRKEARRLFHAGGVVAKQLRFGLMSISRIPLDVEINATS